MKNNYDIVGQAIDGIQAQALIMSLKPDFAILDIEMPGMSGLELAKWRQEVKLNSKIILLSFHREPIYVAQAKALGISGFILKEDALVEIHFALQQLLNGGPTYFSMSVKDEMKKIGQNTLGDIANLTPSERKILKQICQGNSTSDIADKLFISIRTVEKHRSNIIQKNFTCKS